MNEWTDGECMRKHVNMLSGLCLPPPSREQEFTQMWAYATLPVQEKLSHHREKWIFFSPQNIQFSSIYYRKKIFPKPWHVMS